MVNYGGPMTKKYGHCHLRLAYKIECTPSSSENPGYSTVQ